MLYLYLKLKGYEIGYSAGRQKSPDFIIKTKRAKHEIPLEVKLSSSSSDVDKGINQLFEYMKEKKWERGILFLWDISKTGVIRDKVLSEYKGRVSKRFGKVERTIYLVAI